jgi:3-oxoacyl-[acyl-carrier-protein] synthase II
MMKRRVVVTGMGCVTPLGNDVESMWLAQKNCSNGVGQITHFDASHFPTRFAAEVRNYNFETQVEDPARFADAGRNIRFAIGAAKQAVEDSGIHDDREFDPARFGVYLGAGEGQQDFVQFMNLVADCNKNGEPDLQRFTHDFIEKMNPRFELELEPNMPAAHLSSLFNAQGPNLNCLTACAASSQAIGEATEIIRRGDAELMLSGGLTA